MTNAPAKVMNETQAAKVVGLSARTLQRLRLDGGGPRYVQLTIRRVGYTETALAVWIESRTVTSTADATVRRLSAG